jgi:single-strand DNA-binding protein
MVRNPWEYPEPCHQICHQTFACQYLTKGRLVYVEGRLSSRQWQATDGSTRRTVEIVANRLQALSSKSASEVPAA